MVLSPGARRQPDSGVANGVGQVQKNKNSKRMMMFGLRSLSDLCIPPTNRYKENAIAVLEAGIVAIVSEAIRKDFSDEDCASLTCKIFFGISEALKEEQEPELQARFASEGAVDLMISLLGAGVKDDATLVTLLHCMQNLTKLKVDMNAVALTKGIIQCMEEKRKPKIGIELMATLASVVNANQEVATEVAQIGLGKILNYTLAVEPTNKEAPQLVENVFKSILSAARTCQPEAQHITAVMKLMDQFKDRKGIVKAGSSIMASMMGPEQLKKCLESLTTAKEGSDERITALAMLSSMSYIQSYAEAIVKAGSLPLLCNVLTKSAIEIGQGSTDPRVISGFGGVCRMLATIASNPEHIKAVVTAGGLAAMTDALHKVQNSVEAATACCTALSPLGVCPSSAVTMMEKGCLPILLSLIRRNPTDETLLEAGAAVLAAMSSHSQIAIALSETDVVAILDKSMESCTTKSFRLHCIMTLRNVASFISSAQNVQAASVLKCIVEVVKEDPSNVQLAASASEIFSQLAKMTDKATMEKAGVAEALLSLLLSHADNTTIQRNCLDALEEIATEADVTRTLSNLEKALMTASKDPDRAFKALAAVGGLSQIARLRPAFEKQNAADAILKGLESWISERFFEAQQKMITAGLQCIQNLKLSTSGPLDEVINYLCLCQLLPQVKGLIQRQDPLDNNCLDILKTIHAMAQTNRIQSEAALETVVVSLFNIMKKYGETRLIQVHCIDVLNELVVAKGGSAAVSQSGTLKAVLAYMQKVSMYEDVQIAGFRLLHTCLKVDPSMVDLMKRNGALEVVKSATRMYGNLQEVRTYLVPVAALLTPNEELEAKITDNVRTLKQGNLNEDIGCVLTSMKAISQLTISSAGARCAAHLDLAKECTRAVALFIETQKRAKKPLVEYSSALSETAVVMKNLCQTRTGRTALMQAGGVDAVCATIDKLNDAVDSKEKRDGLEACAEVLRSLLKNERLREDEIAYEKAILPRVIKMMSSYRDDPVIFGAACSVGASFRNKSLLQTQDYQEFLDQMISGIDSGDRERRSQCIGALHDLMLDADPNLIEHLARRNCIGVLYKVCDDSVDDLPLLKTAQRCLENMSRCEKVNNKWLKYDEGLPVTVAVTKRVLQRNKADPDACAMSIRILSRFCIPSNQQVVEGSGLIEQMEELVSTHSDHAALSQAFGELLGKLGCDKQIASLFKQIIDVVNKGDADWAKKCEALCNNLAVYLNADIARPEQTLNLAQKCMNSLADALSRNPNAGVMASCMAVSRRLVEKFVDDDNSIYGAKCIQPKMMAQIANVMTNDSCHSKLVSSKKLVCNGFATLSGCLHNSATRKETLDMVMAKKMVTKCHQLLEVHANDPEVVAKILDFLAHVASDKVGANEVCRNTNVKPRSRNYGEDLINEISALMSRHRKSTAVVDAGMQLIANLTNFADPIPTLLTDPGYLRELETIGDASPEGLVATMKVKKRLLSKLSPDDCTMMLKKTISKYMKEMENQLTTSEQKQLLLGAMAQLVGAYADAGMLDQLKEAGAVDLLKCMLEEPDKDSETSRQVLKATKQLATDGDISAMLIRNCGDMLMVGFGIMMGFFYNVCLQASGFKALEGGDVMAAQEVMSVLQTICETEGNGQILAQCAEFKNLMSEISMLAATSNQADAATLKTSINQLNKLIQDDVPEALTLQIVYEKWNARLSAGETLNMKEAATVLGQLDYVANYTQEYSEQSHKSLDTALGAEFMYGCKCFQLLHQYPDNSKYCLDKGEHEFMIAAIRKQKNEHVGQYPIMVCADACQDQATAKAFAAVKNAPLIISDALKRGRSIDAPQSEKEEMLIPRLLLIERVALERMYFNNTDCMAALIGLWDDYDAGKYSTLLLRHVFRAMRQTVNDHFVPTLLKHDVPQRLIAVVNKKDANLELLPDVLFLIGTLAVVPQIRSLIGDLGGCEACLDLLRRCLKNTKENTSRVQTNACLALSNLTLGHGANIARFNAAKGQDLNVEVMNNSMAKQMEYDVANGASILMCNTCFKRDDNKEMYGKKGGPLSIMNTIKRYDGSADNSALRCLNSMFKAIGNLALYTPNVDVFLANGIEQTLHHFYCNSDKIPDNLIETSLKTVANLVMENTEEAMTRFGIILEPLLKMLQSGTRDTVTMLSSCFETLGCLCRLPKNAENFERSNGIETVLRILNNECDESLYANGIFVLGIQTTNPQSVDRLVQCGLFTFLVSLLEQQIAKVSETDHQGNEETGCMATELVVSALRCIRRVLHNKHIGDQFINAGGVKALVALTGKLDDHTMIHLECYRDLIALLDLNPPPKPIIEARPKKMRHGTDWEAEVSDEGVLPLVDLLDRPMSPRAWESIGLEAYQIADIIVNTCTVLGKEENAKQLMLARCGLGLLAYFACEKVEKTAESFYTGNFGSVIEAHLASFDLDKDITQTCCYIINNVAFVSEDNTYAILRKQAKVRNNLENSINKIRNDKLCKEFCLLTSRLLNEKSLDTTRFQIHQQWDYPFSLTQWNKDPYPNGVQDLPIDMREDIRAGNKYKIVLDEGNRRETFYWKSSFDMLQFQWRIEAKEGVTRNAIPAASIKSVNTGLASPLLVKAAQMSTGVVRLSEGVCCLLTASPCPGLPEGVELNIICPSRKARDRFVALLTEWRQAVTYGF